MPVYEAECEKCGVATDYYACLADRFNTPVCESCGGPTTRVISPVMGRVMFPAAGGWEYRSPVSGKPITSMKQRRDDLARTGSRPWEGIDQEKKEAKKRVAEAEAKSDAKLHENVSRAYHQLSPEKRKIIRGAD